MTASPRDDEQLELDVLAAQKGDKPALERVVSAVQDRIYRLCVRTLADPTAAEDAAQDILIRVITHLGSFKRQARFSSWCYRIGVNHLTSLRRSEVKAPHFSFDEFAADLADGAAESPCAEDRHLVNEVRVRCTLAMLLCLDLRHRLAYVLGDILEMDHAEGAAVMEVSPAAFRQRLSRARRQVVEFTRGNCGVVNENAPCRCRRRVAPALAQGRVSPEAPLGRAAPAHATVVDRARELEAELRALCLQQALPSFEAPERIASELTRLLEPPA